MILYVARSLDSSASNLDIIVSAYLSAVPATTGSTLVNTMAVNAFLTTPRGSACSVSAALNSGSTVLGLAGSLVSGPNSQSCSLGGITGLSPPALRTEFGLTVRSPEGGDTGNDPHRPHPKLS
ncbi:MAG: hypothetical protein JST93_20760 [Acidobacteria bacterium]|nr:hypothetical protein [Acidobacteriota bacterium]